MKPITACIIFLALLLPSLVVSWMNYASAKEMIIDDMNQALAKTIQENIGRQITADTLVYFRSNLQTSQLKSTSYIALCTDEPSKSALCSDTMSFTSDGEWLHIRAYPNCSKAAIFGMSEQTVPSLLFLLSIFWGISYIIYLRRKNNSVYSIIPESQSVELGTLSFSKLSNCFYNAKKERINFTPMQHQFMNMLMTSEGHRLSVDEICSQLWRGKDDARDTLYSLIRRLKPVVESNTNVTIHSEKGGYYTLRTTDN